MPQLTLEYSNNLDFDVQAVLAQLHAALVATGAVRPNAIKSRAVCHSQYRIGNGNPDYAFAHVLLWIKGGRPVDVQQQMARGMFDALKETLGARWETGYLSLSVDIHEFSEGVTISEHNIPPATP